ncbi:MAG: hypothetical protein M5R36_21975 [Deltaproteobacteria bacterium]|nr:hypothetical protein [Deltaproteobacteria bacterium]
MAYRGRRPLRAATIDAAGDHRIALAGAVAGTVLPGTVIRGFEAAEVSFPGFLDLLEGAAS